MRRKRPGHAPLLSARPVLASAATEVLEAGVVSATGNVLLFNVRPSHMRRTTHALVAGRIRSSGAGDVTISARLWPAIMSHDDTKPATVPLISQLKVDFQSARSSGVKPEAPGSRHKFQVRFSSATRRSRIHIHLVLPIDASTSAIHGQRSSFRR